MFKKTFTFISIIISIAFFSGYTMGEELMRIYFIPFKVETYVPVTTDDIEKRAFYNFKVPKHSELAIELLKLLEADIPGSFDNKAVRLKVLRGNTSYYVDSIGNIKIAEKISKNKVERLENVINQMIIKYGVKRIN